MFGFQISRDAPDANFRLLHSTPVGRGDLVVYQTNGGATTDFGIVVRQEREILPGVVLTREGPAQVPQLGPQVGELTLRPWLYW